jgi:pyrroloquinoline quinone biosynthesis protein D
VIAATARPALARGVRLVEDRVRGGHQLLAPERALTPSNVAIEILRLCDGERSFDAIVDDLAGRFEADRGLIETEAGAFLEDLANKGMVTL